MKNPEDIPESGPSAEEAVAAAELREALESGRSPNNPEAELAVALGVAWNPPEIDASEHAALIQAALLPKANVVSIAEARTRRAKWTVFASSGTALLALAASVMILVRRENPENPRLAACRSTQELVADSFMTSTASARLDKISEARGRDFRQNRFLAMGVK